MLTHADWKVDCYKRDNGLTVNTCTALDSGHPYDTAVKHPAYGDGRWITVEEYKSWESAQSGHQRWVETMTANDLPSELVDVSTNSPAKLSDTCCGSGWRVCKKRGGQDGLFRL